MEWEYRTVAIDCGPDPKTNRASIDASRATKLNKLGADGWELVSAVPVLLDDVLDSVTYIFKRPADGATWPSRL